MMTEISQEYNELLSQYNSAIAQYDYVGGNDAWDVKDVDIR